MVIISELLNPRREWIFIATIAPVLLYPDRFHHFRFLALLVMPALWTLRALLKPESKTATSPLTLPAVGVVTAAVIATWASPVPEVSAPKCVGIVLGLLVYQTVLTRAADAGGLRSSVISYVVIGTATVIAGSAGTDWTSSEKIPVLAPFAARASSPVLRLPGTQDGVNPNALGATTLFLIPLLVCLVPARRPANGNTDDPPRPRIKAYLHYAVLVVLLTINGMVLLMSQSRIAWAGAAGTTFLALLLLGRPILAACLAGALSLGVFSIFLVRGNPANDYRGYSLSFASRIDIWTRALHGIRDFPVTGLGLNAFRARVDSLYPLHNTSLSRGADIAHAHNIFLQTALDLGLPGLIVYVALILIALVLCASVYRVGNGHERALAVGLGSTVLALHIFGLVDAISLGAKVGVFLWWTLGMIGGLHRRVCGSL